MVVITWFYNLYLFPQHLNLFCRGGPWTNLVWTDTIKTFEFQFLLSIGEDFNKLLLKFVFWFIWSFCVWFSLNASAPIYIWSTVWSDARQALYIMFILCKELEGNLTRVT